MALTINTNLSSLIVQNSLAESTKSLNQAIERMTTGYKINSAKDDAAGYAVATKMETQLSSIQVCQNNVAMGLSLLDTVSSNTDLAIAHVQRMRDLVEQAQNGTYGDDSIEAIQTEFDARYSETARVIDSIDYNGIGVSWGSPTDINFQVGIGSDSNSTITVVLGEYGVVGLLSSKDVTDASTLETCDSVLSVLVEYQTNYGAAANRLESAAQALDIQFQNVTSSLSTIKDADIATESSSYIKAQILQQASATLLATANQTPSIALNLI